MARSRKHHVNGEKHHAVKPRAAESHRKSVGHQPTILVKQALFTTLITILITGLVYVLYIKWLETRVSTPHGAPKAVFQERRQVDGRYWGSYRPGVYFGMKTRAQNSPVAGLMWFSQKISGNQLLIRHWCEMGDYSQRYTWLEHDGENFGLQKIFDDDMVLTTSFVKRPGGRDGGDWTARITADAVDKSRPTAAISLLFYVALDGDGYLNPHIREGHLESVDGNSKATDSFRVSFLDNGSNVLMKNYLSTVVPSLDTLKESVQGSLAYISKDKHTKYIGLIGDRLMQNSNERRPNFVVYQVTVSLPFEMEVTYESSSFAGRPNVLASTVYDAQLKEYREKFNDRFDRIFHLRRQNYSEGEVEFAKAAFSNMVGGIGYFYGQSIVQSQYNKEPVLYFEAPLYTAVPSRSFFPRGFLWDEGFHNLLIGHWRLDIVKDIIAHWLDLMNVEGWIPREQILDRESRARVPAEFVLQRNTNANPPTLFLPLRMIIKNIAKTDEASDDDLQFLKRIFPRLRSWFQWFNTTQTGKLPGTYRWRGRSNHSLEELNPITLTSGLDDFPRASHPTEDERHIDLRCWMALAAGVMADIGRLLDEPWQEYAATYDYLADNSLLDSLHWSTSLQAYADYGLHTGKVRLQKPKAKPQQPGVPPPDRKPIRVYSEEPKLQFVDSFGYVSLFPFLLQILEPSSEKLGRILTDLQRRDLLWTDYGLRSLAKTAPLYVKSNTPDSPPYWRGAIWLNMNYLAVSALHHYAHTAGPYQRQAQDLHNKLKKNLITNLYRQYIRTGYIWEQYDDQAGNGLRAHPFTGWSALITLIMAENS